MSANPEVAMILAIVTFHVPEPVGHAAARAGSEASAPSYQGVPDLVRKVYTRAPDGSTLGGVYQWTSQAAAEAFYDEAWRARLTERFGAPPEIEYLEALTVVDNERISS
ncbi:MAG TPA: hypothetical protein VID93_00490 [Acidimicrobiales bacterium]